MGPVESIQIDHEATARSLAGPGKAGHHRHAQHGATAKPQQGTLQRLAAKAGTSGTPHPAGGCRPSERRKAIKRWQRGPAGAQCVAGLQQVRMACNTAGATRQNRGIGRVTGEQIGEQNFRRAGFIKWNHALAFHNRILSPRPAIESHGFHARDMSPSWWPAKLKAA